MTDDTAAGVPVPLGEFELIARYFSRTPTRRDVLLGVGDDAALLSPPPAQALVVATDTLVEGRHFLPGTPAHSVGHQSLAVNLSDLAAMGADPAWALLSLSLPESDAAWLDGFARGLHALAEWHGVDLVGGDTVRGPRVITITVLGFVPPALALRRSGARPGDLLFVSGTPGVAAAGLQALQSKAADFGSGDPCVQRFLYAEPRVTLGRALRGVATSAMDVSDGLLGDLAKLASASSVGVRLDLERLPAPATLRAGRDRAQLERLILDGGDDYELLFTLPPAHAASVDDLAATAACDLHCIGEVIEGKGVHGYRDGRAETDYAGTGHDHFA